MNDEIGDIMLSIENRINSKEELKSWLNEELNRYGNGLATRLQLNEKGVLRRHQILLRKTEYYINTKKRIRGMIYRFLLYRKQNKYSLHIPTNTCGKGLYILHLGPILINREAIIGQNCSLHINTGIVAGGRDPGAPVLGNNIVVGIGAVILGSISIADGVAVGANAVVNRTISESDIAVAGVPAKKISNYGRKEWNKCSDIPN